MEWTSEAELKIKKAPFFIRAMARRKAEEVAKNRGKIVVDVEDIEAAKGSRELEDLSAMDLSIEGIESSKFLDIGLCGGVKGCPFTLFHDEEVTRVFYRVIQNENLELFMEKALEGPVLFHNKFKIAISGCPNSCSQPQIKDISIVGYHIPKIEKGRCVGCKQCVRSCPDRMITVENEPKIDMEGCIHCGRCIQACPTGAIKRSQEGYRIYVGGRLGRKPHLAKPIADIEDFDELEKILSKVIVFYKECVEEKKSFSKVVEAMELEEIKNRIHERTSLESIESIL